MLFPKEAVAVAFSVTGELTTDVLPAAEVVSVTTGAPAAVAVTTTGALVDWLPPLSVAMAVRL
jgi:hypothetical protein